LEVFWIHTGRFVIVVLRLLFVGRYEDAAAGVEGGSEFGEVAWVADEGEYSDALA
jgi:hypothetical protein